MAATILIIAAYGLGTAAALRLLRERGLVAIAALVAAATGAIAIVAATPGDAPLAIVVEIVVLAGMIPVTDWLVRRVSGPAIESVERRILIRNLFFGAVGIAVLGIGFVDVRRFLTALAMKEGSRADTEITSVADFYVVSKNLGGDPVVDGSSWRLVLPTRSLTYGQLLALPSQRLELTLECISNDVGGTLISNGLWQGPRVTDVLALTGVPADAVWMLMESADGYTESFRLSDLSADHLLVTHLNGSPLPPQHGYPARFLFPGHYGMKQPKWVTRIRFASVDKPGYWENNGWDERAIVKTMSRIDAPADGAALPAGSVRFAGIAFAGARRISDVEVSWDGGRRWQPADLANEFSPYAWRFWQLTATLAAGHYNVRVRARDGQGAWQSAASAPTLPNGADGYHTILLDVR
ncbi:MAG: molybdopterin-dependent oxidoreductase [Candidatus Dormibacteraeota bacterium]|nr:molybdopterin-dependent oxidoreductase [Candidatus Dormibacteraeota bacterium]